MSKIYDHSVTFVVERARLIDDGLIEGGYIHTIVREETGSPTGEREEPDVEGQLGRGSGAAGHVEERLHTEDQSCNREQDVDEATTQELIDSSTSGPRPCEVCNDLYMEPGNFYLADGEKLKRSSVGGCVPCTILEGGLSHFDTKWDQRRLTFAPSQTAFQVSVSTSTLNASDTNCLDFYTLEGTALFSIAPSLRS
jgi:hypothetical protein